MRSHSIKDSTKQSEIDKKYNYSITYYLSFVYLTLLIPLLFFTLRAEFAYAQCNVLCSHYRGDYSTSKMTPFLSPSYEIALEDGDNADSSKSEESPSPATDDNAVDTTYIDAPSKKWHFSIIPYGWFMGLNGKVGVRGQTADIDIPFSDIIKNLDLAVELHAEAWRERFGFFIDATYSKISVKNNVQLRIDRSIKIKNVTEFFLGEFGGFYRVGTWPVGTVTGSTVSKTKKSFTLDILGGGRYWWMQDKVDITGPADLLNPQFKGSKSWFDFIVGTRAKFDINKFFIALRTDIGGFGLGFSSDISWNIAGYIGYELPWYHITPIIGYRALYDKYSDGSGNNRFLWDAWMLGPQLGLAFQF